MKDLSYIVQCCNDFYTKNSNMNITFKEMKDLQGKCDEFLSLMSNKNTEAMDLENSLDSLVLCDEFLEALAYTYSDEMTKQLESFREEGMVEYGLVAIKHKCESYEIYMGKLDTLSAMVKSNVNNLKKGKTDLNNMYNYVNNVESKYRNVIRVINERNYSDENGRSYTERVLNERIAGHNEVVECLNDATCKIDSVIAYYTQLLGKIENEREISTDLQKVARNEERVMLFNNKK